MFRQGTRSLRSLLWRWPWQRISPLAILRLEEMARASSTLRSKSPPTHSQLGQLKEKTDLAFSRLALYFMPPLRVTPSESKYSRSMVSDFSFGYFSAMLIESLIRWLSRMRYSARGLSRRVCIIKTDPKMEALVLSESRRAR